MHDIPREVRLNAGSYERADQEEDEAEEAGGFVEGVREGRFHIYLKLTTHCSRILRPSNHR